ncbi:MAG: four helix bundle protein [Planctomycetota bacterium]|nr:four helix bundle protein [Planctomycetota bacterium]
MNQKINTHRDLIAWQKAFEFGKLVYGLAGKLPDSERFGLVSALRRTAIAVASQIAQGYGRGSTSEYIWHLKHARAELYQLDTQLQFAADFGYITQEMQESSKRSWEEVERVLGGLIRSVERSGHSMS